LDQNGWPVYNPDMHANSSTLLRRLLDPVGRCFSDEGARELVNLRADEETQARVSELAEKCHEGTLSPEERAEYEASVV
jgi:hypothetical protein